MSDSPDRRYEYARMDKLEEIIENMKEDVTKIKIKIFNGFSSKIDSTENKVKYIDKQNEKQHGELSDSIKGLSKKFDKMLWFLMASSFSITAGIILSIVKGWI